MELNNDNNYNNNDETFYSLSRQSAYDSKKRKAAKRRKRLYRVVIFFIIAAFLFVGIVFGGQLVSLVKQGFTNYIVQPFNDEDDSYYTIPEPVTNTDELPYPDDTDRPDEEENNEPDQDAAADDGASDKEASANDDGDSDQEQGNNSGQGSGGGGENTGANTDSDGEITVSGSSDESDRSDSSSESDSAGPSSESEGAGSSDQTDGSGSNTQSESPDLSDQSGGTDSNSQSENSYANAESDSSGAGSEEESGSNDQGGTDADHSGLNAESDHSDRDENDASSDTPNRENNNPNYDLEVISTPDQSETIANHNGEIILFGEEDTTLRGVYGNRDYYFTLPLSSVGDDSYMELTLSSSELLLPDLSTFTVLVNDKPLESISFDEVFEYETLLIPLDKEFLVEGVNKISIQAQTYINDNMCFDQTDSANWVILHKTSYAFIDTRESTNTDDLLKDFPYPFITSGTQDEVHTSIVIPDDSSGEVIKTAVNLSQYLSEQTVRQQVVPVLFEKEWVDSNEEQHVIAIGTMDSWSDEIKNKMTFQDTDLQDNELYLHNTIENAEDTTRQILFVTANNDQTLTEKGAFLTSAEMRKQLTGNSIKIGSMPTMASETVSPPIELSIVEGSVVLDDSRLSSQTFYIEVPTFWTVQDKGTLDIAFRASELMHEWKNEDMQDQLGLTAYVNGTPYTVPLASILEEDMEEDDVYRYSFSIPKERLLNQEMVSVSFEFNYPHTQEGCRQNYKSGNWVTIEADSMLTVPYEIDHSFAFNNWPAALMNQNSGAYEHVAFVLPENVEGSGLEQLALIVNNLSSYQAFDDYIVVRGNTDALDEAVLNDYHFVYLKGTEDEFGAEKDNMLIPWNEQTGLQFSSFGFIEETANYVSWIQPSSYNDNKAMVFFQSLDEEKEHPYVHEKFFGLLGEMDSNRDSVIIVVNKANQAYTFDEQLASDGATPVQGDKGGESNHIVWYVTIFGVVFLMAVTAFLIILRRKRRQPREE